MAKYQQYAEYRNTHNQWLTKIPNHWSLVALKHILSVPMTDGPHETPVFLDEGIPFVSAEAVSSGKIDFTKIRGFITEADDKRFSQKYKPQLHDVYMIKSGATTGITAIFETEDDFNIWSPLAAMRCKKSYDPFFLLNYLRSDSFQKSVQLSWTFGTQQNIGMATLENLPVCVPPKLEQKKIADFLNYETAKIDSLIDKQQQLIQLLKEKRQAVISYAVTKGLNSNAPLKDSGAEWLGLIPEHWETTKIKYVAELTPKKSELSNTDNRLCTFVPMEKLKLGSLIKDEEKPISEVIGGYTYFRDGDLLLAKVTPCFENKNMVIADSLKNGIGFGSSEIYVLRSNSKVDSQFLYYRLQEDQFMELGTGSMTGAGGLKRVPSDFLNNFEFCLPPMEEQLAIAEYLDDYLIKNECLMNKAQLAIQLMQERRTALISTAVTGKIDVRNWQNPTEAKMEFSA